MNHLVFLNHPVAEAGSHPILKSKCEMDHLVLYVMPCRRSLNKVCSCFFFMQNVAWSHRTFASAAQAWFDEFLPYVDAGVDPLIFR